MSISLFRADHPLICKSFARGSYILKNLIEKNLLPIVSAKYSLETGAFEFFGLY